MPDEAAGRHLAAHRERPPRRVEEVDVEVEAHPEGVDAGAAGNQQAWTGPVAVAKGEAEQAGSEILRNGDGGMTVIHPALSPFAPRSLPPA